ncbi:hypothetical protein ACFOHK_07025 [Falsigemmobacter intermedius]|uniref:hypothetical protein n=1 Tax=Falsigemmobacter intermedius TaxID=1553448 RepID=UPI0013E3BDF8|nr:hypothetical protein [Falsigemmobacter intermedius]
MPEIRFFECSCGHKLRFGSARCGWCYERTTLVNRREFWLASGLGLGVSAFALFAALN